MTKKMMILTSRSSMIQIGTMRSREMMIFGSLIFTCQDVLIVYHCLQNLMKLQKRPEVFANLVKSICHLNQGLQISKCFLILKAFQQLWLTILLKLNGRGNLKLIVPLILWFSFALILLKK